MTLEPHPAMSHTFVSRGGLKLQAALQRFNLDVTDFVCADLGCNVGGFTDCLLQRGARHVYAVDTGYGELAWKLRQNPRVTVMERSNALHVQPPLEPDAGVDLVVIDLGWTRQAHAIPAAMRWRPRHIITLIKPHYESSDRTNRRGMLDPGQAEAVTRGVIETMPLPISDWFVCPIRGGKGKGRKGNTEYLAHLRASWEKQGC